MGIFDFLKGKKNNSNPQEDNGNINTPESQDGLVFKHAHKYREYIAIFRSFQINGNFAPISAYEDNHGKLVGFLYMIDEKVPYQYSAIQAVEMMTERFEGQLSRGEIRSYVILYHTNHVQSEKDYPVVDDYEDMTAIAIQYGWKGSDRGYLVLPYVYEGDRLQFYPIDGFSQSQFDSIMETELSNEKNYFSERVSTIAPESTNAAGVLMKKSNIHNVMNMWGGIFGFSHTQTDPWIMEYQALSHMIGQQPVLLENGILSLRSTSLKDISVLGLSMASQLLCTFPRIPSAIVLPVKMREVQEWENFADNMAIVSGRARDTFGVWFFAHDYAIQKEKYLSGAELPLRISGIVFVLDAYTRDPENKSNFADDFTGYFPSSHLSHYGCFDFISIVLKVQPASVGKKEMDGYFLTLKMINNVDDPDFFNLDVFVAKENMRIPEVSVGMHVTGMVQFCGELVG